MTHENFDSVAKEYGFEGVTAESFSKALNEVASTNGRIYFTQRGFESGNKLKLYEKWQSVKLPVDAVKRLAQTVDEETCATNLKESGLEKLVGKVTRKSDLKAEVQKKSSCIYRVYNTFAKMDSVGTPHFIRIVRNEDLSRVKHAVDNVLNSPHKERVTEDLLFDAYHRNPLHHLALNPHLEGPSIIRYMQELKRLDPCADELWTTPDVNGSTPLDIAASELNFAVFDYLINYSTVAREKVIESGQNIVVELLNRHISHDVSDCLKESEKVNNPFEVKQRIRRMVLAVCEAYPELAQSYKIEDILKNNEVADDIRYVIQNAEQLSEKAKKATDSLKAWDSDCTAFEESVRGEGAESTKLDAIDARIQEIETILAKQPPHLQGINIRNEEGLTLLQQKVKEGDIDFVRNLCNPLRFYDHFVDFSNDALMRTAEGIHLLELARGNSEHGDEMIRLLLSKAPELSQKTTEGYDAAALAVEKDQLLHTEAKKQAILKKHLARLYEKKAELEAHVLGHTTSLRSSPSLVRETKHYETPKEKGMGEILAVVFSSGKLIRVLIVSAGTKIKAVFAGLIAKDKGKKIEAQALRTISTIPQEIAQKKLFENRLVQVAANIGSQQVLHNDEDQIAARDLYNRFLTKNGADHVQEGQPLEQMPWGKLTSNPNGWEGIITSGVCWGTAMDIIGKFHEHGFHELETQAASYNGGSPATACANQALYQALETFPQHPAQIVFNQLELLARLNAMEPTAKKGLFNADYTLVQKLFAEIMANEVNLSKDPNIASNTKSEDARKLKDKANSINSNHPLIEMCRHRLQKTPRLMYDDANNSVEDFIYKLRSDWENHIATHDISPAGCAIGLNTLTWLEGLLMQQVGCRDLYQKARGARQREAEEGSGRTGNPRFDKIPDTRLREFLVKADATSEYHHIESKVIEMRGLKQDAIVGFPERHVAPTDADYIRRFPELKDGAYVISFSTQGFQAAAAHSIAYFKKGDDGYIFDPNVGLIKCLPNRHGEDLLQLLSVYKTPKGKSSHDLEIRMVKTIS